MEEKRTVIKAEDVSKYFGVKNSFGKVTKYVKAVDGVSLEIKEGEIYGLVGESGCGKSTFGRTLIRLLEPSGGKLEIKGEDITHKSESELRPFRKTVQMVFQDPYTSLNPRVRVGDMLMEVLKIHGVTDKEERMKAALDTLNKVGLRAEHFYRYPHEFSGGQRQRIGLARALILNPEIIVCDEPVSALDVSIQAQIINLLKELQEQYKFSYLFISHDLSVVEHISDTVGVMYLGSLVEYGDTADIFRNPLHPYTEALFSAIPVPDPTVKMNRIVLQGNIPSPANPPKGCKFHTRCSKCTERCKNEVPVQKEIEPGHYVVCHLYD